MDGEEKTIGLALSTATHMGRQIARGAWEYGTQHANWNFCLFQGMPHLPPQAVEDFRGDGVIGFFKATEIRSLLERQITFVNLSSTSGAPRTVSVDNLQVAHLAADHLLDKGFRRIAIALPSMERTMTQRAKQFQARVHDAGATSVLLPRLEASWDDPSFKECREQVRHAISQLKPPAAIFCGDDSIGPLVIDICLDLGLRVPEDIAVLGVENREFACKTARVPLSSVDIGAHRLGFLAASLLDDLLSDRAPPKKAIRIAPVGIAERQSTDILAIEDEVVRQALGQIHDHYREPILVADVLKALPYDRRTVERRFRKVLNRSLAQELRRLRIRHACRMLRQTELPVRLIAARCGYGTIESFYKSFHREMSLTPGKYREQAR